MTFSSFPSSYSVRTKGASVGPAYTLGLIPTTRDKPNLVRGAGAPASSLLTPKLGAAEAVGFQPDLGTPRSPCCQGGARLLVYARQGHVIRPLQELDETTLSTVHFEGPEVRSDFAGHRASGGDSVPVGNAIRWIDMPESHPQPPGLAHGAPSASGNTKSRAR